MKSIFHCRTLPAALVGVALLGGCSAAFNPIGSNTYDCNRKQDPTSIYCHSFRAVEASTNGELPDSRFDTELRFGDYDKATDIAPVGSGTGERKGARVSGGAGEAVSIGRGALPGLGGPAVPIPDGTPVREGPVVQRTWIKHYVDSNDARIGDMVVYKEVAATHWAGFDGSDPESAQRRMYPHKGDDVKVAQAVQPGSRGQAQGAAAQSDFIQPGPAAAQAVADNPSSSTSMSMPQ